MVAMVHCESVEGEDMEGEGEGRLRTHLLHRCDVSLSVKGLKTGYSRDVHGEVRLEWRRGREDGGGCFVRAGGKDRGESARCAQFKVTDRNVQLFARGTSRTVL